MSDIDGVLWEDPEVGCVYCGMERSSDTVVCAGCLILILAARGNRRREGITQGFMTAAYYAGKRGPAFHEYCRHLGKTIQEVSQRFEEATSDKH